MDQLAIINQHLDNLLQQTLQEGVLDDQFQQLLQLQDESNPDFVSEVVQLYFEDSANKIDKMQQMLSVPSPDYAELDQLVHQFKGSSASLGAQAIAQHCIRLREACQRRDCAACQGLLHAVKESFTVLKSKLDMFLQLESQRKHILASGGH